MNTKLIRLSGHYRAALSRHLNENPARLPRAAGLGHQALANGLETLDLARIHEKACQAIGLSAGPSRNGDGLIKRAGLFFIDAISPIEETHRTAMESNVQLQQLNQMLRQRTRDLAAANHQLRQEITRRQAGEEALRKSERHYRQLLEQSHRQQEQMRHLSHEILKQQQILSHRSGVGRQTAQTPGAARNGRADGGGRRPPVIESGPGKGTTVRAEVPFVNGTRV